MKEFFKKAKKPLIVFASLLVAIFVCLGLAHGIQTDWGKIDVTMGTIPTEYVNQKGEKAEGNLTYKLYKPKGVSEENKAPALLILSSNNCTL